MTINSTVNTVNARQQKEQADQVKENVFFSKYIFKQMRLTQTLTIAMAAFFMSYLCPEVIIQIAIAFMS
jgi:hypothetical protein